MNTLQTIKGCENCQSFVECFEFIWQQRPYIMLRHAHEINHKHEIPYYIFITDVIHMFEEDSNFMKKMKTQVNQSILKKKQQVLKTMR